jgi:hypothetical protein
VNSLRIEVEKARSEAAAFQQEVACREDALREELNQQKSMLAQTTASAEGATCCFDLVHASWSSTRPCCCRAIQGVLQYIRGALQAWDSHLGTSLAWDLKQLVSALTSSCEFWSSTCRTVNCMVAGEC